MVLIKGMIIFETKIEIVIMMIDLVFKINDKHLHLFKIRIIKIHFFNLIPISKEDDFKRTIQIDQVFNRKIMDGEIIRNSTQTIKINRVKDSLTKNRKDFLTTIRIPIRELSPIHFLTTEITSSRPLTVFLITKPSNNLNLSLEINKITNKINNFKILQIFFKIIKVKIFNKIKAVFLTILNLKIKELKVFSINKMYLNNKIFSPIKINHNRINFISIQIFHMNNKCLFFNRNHIKSILIRFL